MPFNEAKCRLDVEFDPQTAQTLVAIRILGFMVDRERSVEHAGGAFVSDVRHQGIIHLHGQAKPRFQSAKTAPELTRAVVALASVGSRSTHTP